MLLGNAFGLICLCRATSREPQTLGAARNCAAMHGWSRRRTRLRGRGVIGPGRHARARNDPCQGGRHWQLCLKRGKYPLTPVGLPFLNESFQGTMDVGSVNAVANASSMTAMEHDSAHDPNSSLLQYRKPGPRPTAAQHRQSVQPESFLASSIGGLCG